ncbi:MAG TPA: heme exporter protein CcmD [Terriglobales bacterium]|nr:heme exporter protein CcmD [Terriglobales bacterium]
MGGYAPFIWPAYGVAALVLIAFAIDSWRRVHQATTALRRLEAEAALLARPAGNKTAGNKTTGPVVSAQPGRQETDRQKPDQQVGS